MLFRPGVTSLFETSLKLRASLERPYSDSYASTAALVIYRDPEIVEGRLTMEWPPEALQAWWEVNTEPPTRQLLDFQSKCSRRLQTVPISTERRDSALILRVRVDVQQLRLTASLLGQEFGRGANFGKSLLLNLFDALQAMPGLADSLAEPGVTSVEVLCRPRFASF